MIPVPVPDDLRAGNEVLDLDLNNEAGDRLSCIVLRGEELPNGVAHAFRFLLSDEDRAAIAAGDNLWVTLYTDIAYLPAYTAYTGE
jgi:hypothetical protein